MKNLCKKLLILTMAMIITLSSSIISADARVIKGYPNGSDISFEPRVEYEFTGPHTLYINDNSVKRNILRQKIYDNSNNKLLVDNVYIPIEDILYELNYFGFDTCNEPEFERERVRIGVPEIAINGDKKRAVYSMYVYNVDYDIQRVDKVGDEIIKYQDKYYITPDLLTKLISLVTRYCRPFFGDTRPFYDTISDAAVFNSDGIMLWLVNTPEYQEALIEKYYKANQSVMNVSLEQYKQDCPETIWTLYETYLSKRAGTKNKWAKLYDSRW